MPAFQLLTVIDTYVVSSWGGDDDHMGSPLAKMGLTMEDIPLLHIYYSLYPCTFIFASGRIMQILETKKIQRYNNSPLSVCPQTGRANLRDSASETPRVQTNKC